MEQKYHYYGIAVRDSSIYYEVMYSAKSATSTTADPKKELPKQVVSYSPRSKLGTLLPDFPDISQIVLPEGVEETKVVTFLMMYRTHCQRLLDTVIRASFDEVQTFLLHFWQGVPSHLTPILACDVMVKVIGVCDSVLYKAVAGVLMPSVLQALPDSLTQVIRRFGRQLEDWLRSALHGLPQVLTEIKLDLARRFSQVVKRQISLNHLVQASRTVVNSQEMVTQLLADWLSIDLGSILKQTLYTMEEQDTGRENKAITHMCTEFEKLLEDQAPVEAYIEWLDNMVDSCVVKVGKRTSVVTMVKKTTF
ncbi:regulatory factor X, 4 [Elysia marginata]|uniref:Regulatory factor X, 4 n=1 Tax=Elysia marginata TaxID=1093978 RepID=A0AAV4GWT1_9GAST|nr:regulatory factor X, 4 [Elysia marginata]